MILFGVIPITVAALMALYLLAAKRAAGEIGFPLDDSWIHVRFAQNLSRGLGFSFNPGEATSTTTAALWTLLFAAAYRITHEFLFTSFALNWLLCALLCVVVYHLALALRAGRWAALLAAATAAVTAPLPWWALSGMEPPLYALLSVTGILLHHRLREATGLRSLLSTVVLALAALARPECLVLFPLAILDRAVVAWRRGRKAGWAVRLAREAVVHTPIFALIIAPLFVYNHWATGYWLPSSFYSKEQALSIPGALAGRTELSVPAALAVLPAWELRDVVKLWAGNNPALLLPFLYGLWLTAARAWRAGGEARSLMAPLVVVARPVAWALAAGYRAAGYQSQRYFADVNVLFLVLGVVGGEALVRRVWTSPAKGVTALLAGAVLAASLAGQPAAAGTYARNVKNITEMQVEVGRWLKANARPGSLLAVNDIGAIGVITGDPVLDLQGLVTPEILERRSLRHRADGTAPRRVFEFLAARRPDYLVVFPNWYPEYGMMPALFTEVHRVELEDNITCGGPVMVVYRADWSGMRNEARRRSQ